MKLHWKSLLVLLTLFAFLFGACVPTEVPAQVEATVVPTEQEVKAAEPALPTKELTLSPVDAQPNPTSPPLADDSQPEAVAQKFFEAYIAGENNQKTVSDPDFEYQKYLSQEYLQQVVEIKAGFEGFGFDPIIQAQMFPPGPVEVKESHIDGNQATVVLQFGRNILPQPWERIVSLERIEGQWLIVPDRTEYGSLSPQETVDAFYRWYLGYICSGEQIRNPLVEKSYRAAPFLTPMFVSQIDQLLESENGLMADPFLCAQDIPSEMKAIAYFDNDSRPLVLVQSSFPDHYVVVNLIRANFNSWQIRDVTCTATPSGKALAFYNWVLGYMTQKEGDLSNPWVDGAYQQSSFLAKAFIQKLDEMISTGSSLPADPILLAQSIPSAISTQLCLDENCALVNLQFGESTLRQLRVEFITEDGLLRIAEIRHGEELESPQPVNPPNGIEHWVPLLDEQYGYAIRYPADWAVTGLHAAVLSNPEGNPIVRTVFFTNPEQKQYVPFSLDVFTGSEANLLDSYGFNQEMEQTDINGNPVHIYRNDPGILYYAFPHPDRDNIWIVISDSVTEFPGRDQVAKTIEGIFPAMISTLVFGK